MARSARAIERFVPHEGRIPGPLPGMALLTTGAPVGAVQFVGRVAIVVEALGLPIVGRMAAIATCHGAIRIAELPRVPVLVARGTSRIEPAQVDRSFSGRHGALVERAMAAGAADREVFPFQGEAGGGVI